MRRLVVWSFVAALAAGHGTATAGSAPAAGEAPAASSTAPRATLVQVLGAGKQALVLDRNQGAYVVVRVGERIQGFAVLAIESDQLVLADPGGTRHYVLPLAAAGANDAAPSARGPVAAPVTRPGSAPLDPYASSVIAPYESGSQHGSAGAPFAGPAPQGIKAVVAPPGSRASSTGAPGTAAATPGTAAATPGTAAATPGTDATPGTIAATPRTSHSADEPPRRPPGEAGPRVAAIEPPVLRSDARRDAAEERQSLSRRSLEAALADFGALAREMKLRVVPGRGFELVDLARGSLPHRLGLRAGDVVLSIAGRQITSVDAAAAAYVALDRASSFAIVVERDGKRLTLRYALTP